jgi:hypothetical protein
MPPGIPCTPGEAVGFNCQYRTGSGSFSADQPKTIEKNWTASSGLGTLISKWMT